MPVKRIENLENKFEGAIVIDPERGYYKDPIATLDFASLYPSIMMAHNLCYTTLIPNKIIAEKNYDRNDYTITPHGQGDYFMKASKKKGILP